MNLDAIAEKRSRLYPESFAQIKGLLTSIGSDRFQTLCLDEATLEKFFLEARSLHHLNKFFLRAKSSDEIETFLEAVDSFRYSLREWLEAVSITSSHGDLGKKSINELSAWISCCAEYGESHPTEGALPQIAQNFLSQI